MTDNKTQKPEPVRRVKAENLAPYRWLWNAYVNGTFEKTPRQRAETSKENEK